MGVRAAEQAVVRQGGRKVIATGRRHREQARGLIRTGLISVHDLKIHVNHSVLLEKEIKTIQEMLYLWNMLNILIILNPKRLLWKM
jgi:hypothetical protein